ncbi:hypothetical protein KUCAC02_014621 [Chaenocephalus aceratus]|uniref:Uncharacterized protein n=1 Tax=Chaenocephalus aceratus TaxID=36190 RepID=A0ACB9WG81_CHAAC|nr:hypothetical protein KUCAC02_014621 [Chaenocephalus aceratus]
MGPFQEYEEKKSPEKGSPRSRIPRLVLHPFPPKDKGRLCLTLRYQRRRGRRGTSARTTPSAPSAPPASALMTPAAPLVSLCPPPKPRQAQSRVAHGSPVLPERKTKVKSEGGDGRVERRTPERPSAQEGAEVGHESQRK